MSNAKNLAKGGAWDFLGLLTIRLTSFFHYVILVMLVSQETIGIFSLVLSIVSIIIIFSNFGMGNASVVRYVPFYMGVGKFNHIRKVLKISFIAGTMFSLICMAILIFFSEDLSQYFGEPKLINVFYIMSFYLIVYNLSTIASGFLQGKKLIKLNSFIGGYWGVSKLIFTVVIIFLLGATADSVSLGFLLSFLSASIFGLWWMVKEYRKLPHSNENVDTTKLLKEMIAFGLVISSISVMSLLNSYTDRIMMGSFLEAETKMAMIGVYTIAVNLSSQMIVFVSAVGTIFYPVVSELWGKRDIEGIKENSKIFMRWIVLVSIPILLVILIFPSQILTIIYTQEYSIASTALVIYTIGLFFYTFAMPSQHILAAMKRLDITLKIVVVGAVTNILLNFIFIPKYGINGAALTSAISFTIMTILFLRQSEITRVQFPKDVHKPIIAGIFAAIILYSTATVFNFDEFLINFVSSAITEKDIFSEILLKFLKMFVLGIFVLIAFSVYLVFLIKFKAFHKEDVEILVGGMRRVNAPERFIMLSERILIG